MVITFRSLRLTGWVFLIWEVASNQNEKILLIPFIIIFSRDLHVQKGWFPLKTAPISKIHLDICFIYADIGTLRTSDGGVIWTNIDVYGSRSKFFNNNKIGFSYNRGVAHTSDGGISWTRENVNASCI